ncbi:5-formyltetrahydrofolate cyclo-ligase [Candidatus Woesearchaeota archaeon]|nr:5-formyltetrahydrofolate cyclo-ligase [Candidatus Woesearchaeota archaeon]
MMHDGFTAGNSEKGKIRKEMKKKRDAVTDDAVKEKSAAIMKKLITEEDFAEARTVLLYCSKGNEVQTEELIRLALKSGKRVILPITDLHEEKLELSEITAYPEDLKKGAFGIMEPKEITPVDESAIDAAIIPGLAFDTEGHRLGYGLGFYDKLIERLVRKRTNISVIGLAYESHVLKKLPRENHDREMGMIITESRTVRCRL